MSSKLSMWYPKLAVLWVIWLESFARAWQHWEKRVKDGGKGEVPLQQPIGLSETRGTKLILANRRARIKTPLSSEELSSALGVKKKYTITWKLENYFMFPHRVPCIFFNCMIQWIYCKERKTFLYLLIPLTRYITPAVVQNIVQRWHGILTVAELLLDYLRKLKFNRYPTVEHYFSPKYTILHTSTLKIHYKRTFKKLRRWHITLMPLSEILWNAFCMSIIVCRRVCRFASQLIPSSWMHLR